jgi:hypothetical protein
MHMATPPPDKPSFEPEMTSILSQAIDDACNALHIAADNIHDREIVAARIVDLARTGVVDAAALRDRVVQESKSEI